jgi:hypothetical protein
VQPTVQPPCNHFDFHDGGRCLLRCMSLLLALFGHGEMSELSPLSGVKLKSDFGDVRAAFDPGCVKTFFLPQKLHATGDDPRRHDGLSIFLLYRSLESLRAQPRAMLSDLNGHTARTTVHAPQARIAARSGLIPTMFITRVRL